MQLSTLEMEILEKATRVTGTTCDQHIWVSEADFFAAAERLVDLQLLDKQIVWLTSDEKIQIYKRVK